MLLETLSSKNDNFSQQLKLKYILRKHTNQRLSSLESSFSARNDGAIHQLIQLCSFRFSFSN